MTGMNYADANSGGGTNDLGSRGLMDEFLGVQRIDESVSASSR